MRTNRLAILQGTVNDLPIRCLDITLLPCVACDCASSRHGTAKHSSCKADTIANLSDAKCHQGMSQHSTTQCRTAICKADNLSSLHSESLYLRNVRLVSCEGLQGHVGKALSCALPGLLKELFQTLHYTLICHNVIKQCGNPCREAGATALPSAVQTI